jgi:hypothetical protein
VILDVRQLGRGNDGVGEHGAVRGDQRHARAGRGGRARRPVVERARRPGLAEAGRGLVVKEAPGRDEARFERIDGGVLERGAEVEARREDAHRHESDERQRQLDRDTPPQEVQHVPWPSSRSKR